MNGIRPPVRSFVVGYGYWGRRIARVISRSSRVVLTGIADTSTAAIRQARSDYPAIEIGDDPEGVAARAGAELAFVAVPPPLHWAVCRSLLRAGIHTSVEKPFTTSANQAQELVQMAGRTGVVLAVDYTYIMSKAIRRAARIAKSGMLGDVKHLRFTRINDGSRLPTDVNVAHDLLCHDYSIAYLIFGAPLRVRASEVRFTGNILTALAVHTTYSDGQTSAHDVDWFGSAKQRTLDIIGSRGKLSAEQSSGILRIDSGSSVSTQAVTMAREPLLNYVELQARRVRGARRSEPTGSSTAVDILRVLEAVIYSAVSGQGWISCR